MLVSNEAIGALIGDRVATSRFSKPGYDLTVEHKAITASGSKFIAEAEFSSPFQYTLTPTWMVVQCFNEARELQNELCVPREKILSIWIRPGTPSE